MIPHDPDDLEFDYPEDDDEDEMNEIHDLLSDVGRFDVKDDD